MRMMAVTMSAFGRIFMNLWMSRMLVSTKTILARGSGTWMPKAVKKPVMIATTASPTSFRPATSLSIIVCVFEASFSAFSRASSQLRIGLC